MKQPEALAVIRVLMGAFEQSWKPSEDAIRVYMEILAVPELDAEASREAVLKILHSAERFAPTPGMIYQAALARSGEKARQLADRRAREILGGFLSAASLIDFEAAVTAVERDPCASALTVEPWRLVARYLEQYPQRFAPRKFLSFRSVAALLDNGSGQSRCLRRTAAPLTQTERVEE